MYLADQPDSSGLTGFDFPLVYISKDTLNQPIFGSNNLQGQYGCLKLVTHCVLIPLHPLCGTGEVWPAVDGGGPAGTLPPHNFTLYFMEGGIGTFYPMYYTLAERAKRSFSGTSGNSSFDPNPVSFSASLASRAFVDPNDPTTVYLTQPAEEDQRLPERPIYAANYGHDDAALTEDMVPGHGRRDG